MDKELLDPIKARWAVVWPAFVDGQKSTSAGRRVKKEVAVQQPSVIDLAFACMDLKLTYHVERFKQYPRDFLQVGRVRVQLFDENHQPLHPEIRNRNQLFTALAVQIPKSRAMPRQIPSKLQEKAPEISDVPVEKTNKPKVEPKAQPPPAGAPTGRRKRK